MSIDLRKLMLGALAAERDIGEGLKDYFVQSDAFKALLDGRKTVALGSRGSGKTAIFKMIAERETKRKTLVLELAPEDYSYELLSQALTAEARGAWMKHGAYAAAWKFLIYVMAMKAVTKGGGFKQGPSARIYNYLRDNHADADTNPIGMLVSYLKRLEGVKIGNIEAALKTRQLHSLYKLEPIETLMADLDQVTREKHVVVLVDELDRGWDASEDAIAFVAGLFQAATAVNTRLPHLRVLISLRRELYENIPALYEDAQKVRDLIQVIEWDEPQLMQLIAKRIAFSVPEAQHLTAQEQWNLLFAETLDYRKSKSFNYVVDRTLYRPRELLQFCISMRDTALGKRMSPPLNYSVVSEAEHTYSEERAKDIVAEYKFQYPGLGSVFESFRGRSYTLERDELELHCLGLAVGELRVAPEAVWAREAEPDKLIDVLWRVGFLRAQAVGGLKARRRSGSSYLGSHQVSSLNLANIQRFHVHPMFRSYLGLKEAKHQADD